MNFSRLLKITSAVAVVMAAGISAQSYAETTKTVEKEAAMASTTQNTALKFAAEELLGHVSEAQIALTYDKLDVAGHHIDKALEVATSLRGAAPEYTKRERVEYGRINYSQNNKASRNYYIPIVEDVYTTRTYKTGPWWSSEKGVAVKNAEIVYVSINMDSEKVTKQLNDAKKQVNDKDIDGAYRELSSLTDSLISKEESRDLPLQKAADNFYLARRLIAQENYDGARYALKNADSALDKVERDDKYANRRDRITAMRKELSSLKNTVEKRDPSMLTKSGETLNDWWGEIKGWSEKTL